MESKKVTGGPGLKASQAYPMHFGHAVAKLYQRKIASQPGQPPHQTTVQEAQDTIRALRRAGGDLWCDAGILDVLHYLRR